MSNMEKLVAYLFILITVFTIELDAVTVNPALCPTNKIAPHRRTSSGSPRESRTLRVFYDLLAPQRPYIDPYNDLQEQPQEDDPNDCGEIEDYDETDLSSVTHQAQRKKDRHDRRLFDFFHRPSYSPPPATVPPRPQRPPRTPPPTRPPFWSGGIFGLNTYRPPQTQYPSNYIKPVHEDASDTPAPYRPEVVGGALGHVVGFTTTTGRPTRRPRPGATTQKPFRFPNDPVSHTRVPRTRHLNPSTSIVGSFVDLILN